MIGIALLALVAQSPKTFEGKDVLDRLNALSSKEAWASLPIGERVARTATALIDTPYEAWTLEQNLNREYCYISLKGLDCVTLFETSLGYARALKHNEKPSAGQLLREVTNTRYRGGQLSGYLSRLHYTGEWMYDNELRKNVVWAETSATGTYQKDLDFMSSHPDSYRQLKANPEWVMQLRMLEIEQGGRRLRWIPKADVAGIEKELQTGDVVGIATSGAGMDCSHTGLIVRKGNEAHFLHASSAQKKVVQDGRISEYLSRSEKNLGILVVRPLEVAK